MRNKKGYVNKTIEEEAKQIIEAQESWYRQNRQAIDIAQSWYRQNQQTIDTAQSWYKQNQQTIDMAQSWYKQNQQIIEAQKMWHEQIQAIIELCNNIDWDSMREVVAELGKDLNQILAEQVEDYWCLDMDIAIALANGKITKDGLSEYVDEKIDSFIEEIVQDPIYELHATLILETYEAYKVGLYKLCAMPLFAAFEHVVKLWCLGYIKKEKIVVNLKPDIWGVKKKIAPKEYNHIEKENLSKIFALSVFRMYEKTFDNIPKQLGHELNRNAIAHGYYDYDSVSKIDILKLFQLLKSTLILKSFEPNKVAES
ncbi:hypothetical protein CN939_03825 [Bacillus thuringiensis]|nr:hypothetical protein [Bacillus thuringiensis]PEF86450.1 hypothetical protein CON51_16160 [Bacillus thuringiensis]PES50694.1 hypothetical protein CN506_25690 [Bacillus thuringiensis]PGL67515.1 hypothetical protein CN939_03825 [Bacillus thuringiensis]